MAGGTVNSAITQDQLSALRSSHQELWAEARDLMARLRASVFEMRVHRARLRDNGHDPSANGLLTLGKSPAPVPPASRVDRCRWSTMIMLEANGELATAEVDMGPAGRPPLVQPRVDADNFPDRPLAWIGTGTRSEPYA